MAKGKVHKEQQRTDPLAPMMENGERGGHLEVSALCRQRHRKLLPLLLSNEWDAVTCERCLTHRPAPAASWMGAQLARLMKWFRGGR